MKRWHALMAGLSCLACAVSCASTARVTGGYGEYRSYRQTRVATTLEAKLGASQRYLQAYPHGDYYEEVRQWFAPAEKRYFKLAWDNLARLHAYDHELPKGPHAQEVRERIVALESVRASQSRREQRFLDRAQGFEDRLADAAEQRRQFLREVTQLTRALGATRTFGQRTSELDSELLLRFRVRQPPGRCEGERCSKVFPFTYAVPEDKSLSDRHLDLLLEIELDRGGVQRLSLSGPELLSRIAEAARVKAVAPGNPQARAEALGQGLDVLSDALEGPLPAARCTSEAVSPIVLARRCDGVRLEIIAGIEPGAADRVVVRAEKH